MRAVRDPRAGRRQPRVDRGQRRRQAAPHRCSRPARGSPAHASAALSRLAICNADNMRLDAKRLSWLAVRRAQRCLTRFRLARGARPALALAQDRKPGVAGRHRRHRCPRLPLLPSSRTARRTVRPLPRRLLDRLLPSSPRLLQCHGHPPPSYPSARPFLPLALVAFRRLTPPHLHAAKAFTTKSSAPPFRLPLK